MTAQHFNPIKAGICSFGMSGKVFHAPFLSCMDQYELTVVTERHEKKASEKYPNIRSFSSVETMLEDKDLELVIVNTPNVTHYDYAMKALKAGKDVVIEKPFTATLEQALDLKKTAGDLGRKLVVFQNRRWDSDFRVVEQIVEEKRLGELIEAEIHFDRFRSEPSAKKHKEKPDSGVGLIFDLGPHIIDQAIVLFGQPQAVFARVQKHRPGSLVDDYFNIQLLYGSFTCILKASLLVREQGPGYILHGTKGSFLKSRADIQEKTLIEGAVPCNPGWGEEPISEEGLLHTEEAGQIIRKKIPTPNGDYKLFYSQLYDYLRKDGPSPVELSDSLLNMQIIEAALKSQRDSLVVKLD